VNLKVRVGWFTHEEWVSTQGMYFALKGVRQPNCR
jgi:hypothetical protein